LHTAPPRRTAAEEEKPRQAQADRDKLRNAATPQEIAEAKARRKATAPIKFS